MYLCPYTPISAPYILTAPYVPLPMPHTPHTCAPCAPYVSVPVAVLPILYLQSTEQKNPFVQMSAEEMDRLDALLSSEEGKVRTAMTSSVRQGS